MAQTSRPHPEEEELRLDQVLLYLIAKEAENRDWEGFKIPMTAVHQIVHTIEGDLEDLGIRLKFHESVGDVHSQQVDKALKNIIPYLIPVSNPSFSLDVYDRIGKQAFERADDWVPDQYKQRLDEISRKDSYRQVMEDHIGHSKE